jgi:hypothetical protein
LKAYADIALKVHESLHLFPGLTDFHASRVSIPKQALLALTRVNLQILTITCCPAPVDPGLLPPFELRKLVLFELWLPHLTESMVAPWIPVVINGQRLEELKIVTQNFNLAVLQMMECRRSLASVKKLTFMAGNKMGDTTPADISSFGSLLMRFKSLATLYAVLPDHGRLPSLPSNAMPTLSDLTCLATSVSYFGAQDSIAYLHVAAGDPSSESELVPVLQNERLFAHLEMLQCDGEHSFTPHMTGDIHDICVNLRTLKIQPPQTMFVVCHYSYSIVELLIYNDPPGAAESLR